VADLVVDAAAVTTEQAVTKTLPAAYDVTATLAPHLIPTFAPTPAGTLAPAGLTPALEQGFALPSTAALAGGLAGMVLLAALLVRHTTSRRPRKVYDAVRHGSDGRIHPKAPAASDSQPVRKPAPKPAPAPMRGPPAQLAQSWSHGAANAPLPAPMPLSPQQMQLAQLAAQHAAQREQQARQALLVRQQAELRQLAYVQRQSNRQHQLDRFQRSQEPGSALTANVAGQQQVLVQQMPAQQAPQFDLATAIWQQQQQQAAQQPLPALSLQRHRPASVTTMVPNYLGQGALASAAARNNPAHGQELTTSPGARLHGLPQGRLVHAPPNFADDEQPRETTFL
jgi:hypothetical protein